VLTQKEGLREQRADMLFVWLEKTMLDQPITAIIFQQEDYSKSGFPRQAHHSEG
jgi:hypothetical protein